MVADLMQDLQGVRVWVTRERSQSEETCSLLQSRGAIPLPVATIAFAPPDDPAPLNAALAQLRSYSWLIFSSVAAVEFFDKSRRAFTTAPTLPDSLKVAAVGQATANRLRALGLKVDIVPDEFRAEGLIKALSAYPLSGQRILLPRAESARDILPDTLRQRGANVDVVALYKTTLPPRDTFDRQFASQQLDRADAILLTSGSTVRNLVTLLGGEKSATKFCKARVLAVIGPLTEQACREASLPVHVTPAVATVPALVDALAAYFRQKRPVKEKGPDAVPSI